MPVALDHLTRIIDIRVGGTVFVYGLNYDSNLYYVKFKNNRDSSPTMRTVSLPVPMSGLDFSTRGSSYALAGDVPTFLACGGGQVLHQVDDGLGNEVTVVDSHAFVFASNDGLAWTVSRQESVEIPDLEHPKTLNPHALVWNSGHAAFYYDQAKGETEPAPPTTTILDEIFSSSGGGGWADVSSTETQGDPEYQSDFLALCSGNDCVDERGQNVPDGVMAHDEETDVTIKPQAPPIVLYEGGGILYAEGSSVEVVTAEGSFVRAIPGLAAVTCVAGANGIFMAGGFVSNDDSGPGCVAVSFDSGQTWEVFASTLYGVTTMIAASSQDLASA